jgi:transcription elongation factor Elf1
MSQTTVFQELPAVARSVSLTCSHCETERFFKVLAHLSTTAAKLRCEVCGRSKTLRLGEGSMSDDSTGNATGTTKTAKEKKPRNTAGLVAAAEKRKVAAAERKAETAARKEAEVRADYARQYESLKTQIGTKNVQPYGMKANFPVAAAVQHPTFGLGFVTISTVDRIEVAFESGVRQLIHNRA